jgi:hypothetical protein
MRLARPALAAVLVASAAALLLPPAGAGAAPRSLRGCVAAWNGAKLGTGKVRANATAAFGHDALLVPSTDGGCVLAFPLSQSEPNGADGVLVSGRGGDYPLGYADPLGTERGPRPPRVAVLQARAARAPNVRMAPSGGTIAAVTSAAAPGGPAPTVLGARQSCARFEVGLTVALFATVARHGVDCVTVRMVAFAVVEGEAAPGWRCSRFEAYEEHPKPLVCADGAERFKLRRIVPHLHAVPGLTASDAFVGL